jgi:hypothetical protein
MSGFLPADLARRAVSVVIGSRDDTTELPLATAATALVDTVIVDDGAQLSAACEVWSTPTPFQVRAYDTVVTDYTAGGGVEWILSVLQPNGTPTVSLS